MPAWSVTRRLAWVLPGALLALEGRAVAQSPPEAPTEAPAAEDTESGPRPPELLAPLSLPTPDGLDAPTRVEAFVVIDATGAVTEVTIAVSGGAVLDAQLTDALRAARFRPARVDGVPVPARVRYAHTFEPPPPRAPAPEPDVGPPPPAAPVLPPEDLPPVEDSGLAAVAVSDAPPREPTRRTIEQAEMVSIAGTRGDPLRSIELLPGVARPTGPTGDLIVRGSAPTDSQVFLEGAPVPLLYHFGGLTSFFQGRLIDRIDFYPSNFSVRYGRRIGAVVEVGVDDERPPDFGGFVDFNLIDASFLVEAPLGDKGSVAIAARRSWLDAWFGAVLSGADGLSLTTAPVYWDFQALATYRPTPRDTLRLMTYASRDDLRLLFEDPPDADPAFRGGVGTQTRFAYVDLEWRHRYGARADHTISLASGPLTNNFQVGATADFAQDSWNTNLRAEWRIRPAEDWLITAGLDVFVSPTEIDYEGPRPQQAEGNPDTVGGQSPLSSQGLVNLAFEDTQLQPAAYVELAYSPGPLRVIAGARVDYYGILETATVDPRVSVLYEARDDLTLKLGVGTFSQAPELNESSAEIGNPDLDPLRAVHVTGGFQYRPAPGMSVGVEGFYKYLWDRVVDTEDGQDPIFINRGIGHIYGGEVSARIQPRAFGDRFFGFLAYTLSRSERRDRPGDAFRLFDFDQTHILTLSGTTRLPKGWEVGLTLRLISGNPVTPIVGGVFNPASGIYAPVFGGINAERNPAFHRLDFRVQKTWTYDNGAVALYLDVQNVYNRQNPEGFTYSFNYRERSTQSGLPIIPSLGLRGEF